MKRLVALMMCATSVLAEAQFPNLPYNPDENGDGLIGVVDLQGLLSNYGAEFASAVVSEDGENAIVFMGEMVYPVCAQECKSLPGFWEIPTLEELGLVWDEVHPYESSSTWLKPRENRADNAATVIDYLYSSQNGSAEYGRSQVISVDRRCYCAAKQIPRVEYDYCEGFAIQECISLKVSEGWLPLGATESEADNCQCGIRYHQSFWRWAE